MWVNVVQQVSLEKSERHSRQHTAPDRTAAVVVFSSDDRIAQPPLRLVVIHGDLRMVYEKGSAFPMIAQAFQGLSLRWVKRGFSQLAIARLSHRSDGGAQCLILPVKRLGIRRHLNTLDILGKQIIDEPYPVFGPTSKFYVAVLDAAEVSSDMAPAEGNEDLLSQSLIGPISVSIHNPLGIFPQVVFGHLGRARRFQKIGAGVSAHNNPQPPSVADFALRFLKNHPPCFIHVPMICCATSLEDPCIKRLEERTDALETSGESSLGDAESLERQHLPDTIERSLEKELLQQKPDPEACGEHAFGDEFCRRRCGDNAWQDRTIAGGEVTSPFVNETDQAHLPVDLIGIFGAGKADPGLTTLRTTLLLIRYGMVKFLRGKPQPTLSAMALGTRLLASLVLNFRRDVGRGEKILLFVMIFGSRAFSLFRLSAEYLFLQLGDFGFERLILLGQLRNLCLLLSDELLKMPRLFFPLSSSFERSSMLRPPVSSLLSEFNTLGARLGDFGHALIIAR